MNAMRCDCEADYCKCHRNGACPNTDTAKVQAFGYGQWLCTDCLDLAKFTLGFDLVTDPARFE